MATHEKTVYAGPPMQNAPQENTAYSPTPPAASMQAAPQNDDVAHWVDRAKHAVNNPQTVTGPSAAGAQPWHNRFVMFFDPIDTCLVTCCCPCVTFGKTHHRLHKDAELRDYNVVNTSCLGWWATACCGVSVVMNVLQRQETNRRFGLQGSFPIECFKGFCCQCCDLVQQDKEVQYQLLQNGAISATQPTVQEEMKVPV